jgi:hypothetical protein
MQNTAQKHPDQNHILNAQIPSHYNWFFGEYKCNQPAIIIGGCGRSGTTLLRVILDSHFNLACGPESGLFTPTPIDIAEISYRFDIPLGKTVEIFNNCKVRGEFIQEYLSYYARANNKKRWVEKSPKNITQLDYIFSVFPRAKFIHMLRDGRDVSCSLRFHPRFKTVNGTIQKTNIVNPFINGVKRWFYDINSSRSYWSDPRLLAVKYEDLVASPLTTLQKVMTFIHEPWDSNLLTHEKFKSPSRSDYKNLQNPETQKPLYKNALNRWQREMSEPEKDLFKAIAGDLLVELGYSHDQKW